MPARRPATREHHSSFALAHIDAVCLGAPTYFVSHAWGNLFGELVDAVAADLEGAAQDETFLWLDIFAINQDDSGGAFAAMVELDDGRTLAAVIEQSRATKVVLDKERVAPLRRLWCALPYCCGLPPLCMVCSLLLLRPFLLAAGCCC